jgi:hypothetical protein
MPVFSTTGLSPAAGALVEGVDPVGAVTLVEVLELAAFDPEAEEQALSEMTAAPSSANSTGPLRSRVRATLPIEFHSVGGTPAVGA